MKGTDILTTAVEGGINYWATLTDSSRAADGSWLEVTLNDDVCDDVTIKAGQMVAAARSFVNAYPKSCVAGEVREALADDDAGMIDADGADAIVQMLVFGELVYG